MRTIYFILIFTLIIFLDSFSWGDDTDSAIIKYRTGSATLLLKGRNGEVLKNTNITIEMTRHAFLFGCNLFSMGSLDNEPEKQKIYRDNFVHLFNYATIPFYWSMYEQAEGVYSDEAVSNMALWCRSKGIRTKGHPLVWHESLPYWMSYSRTEIENVLEKRVKSIIDKYKGLIDAYDVINESLSGPYSDNSVGKWEKDIGPLEAARRCVSWAREQNPGAFILVNDFNTTTAYASEISVLNELGFPPDAIGLQSHMHKGVWTDIQVNSSIDLLSHFGIPIHFTELTILSGRLKTDDDWNSFHPDWDTTPEGEKRQAQETERIYRLLFSSPYVGAITWWDFSDYNSWQGAPAGLLRKDMTKKPAYDILLKLIRHEWWTGPLELKSDSNGRVAFRGFFGSYRAVFDAREATFDLGTNALQTVFFK